jgi:hypothetical protein
VPRGSLSLDPPQWGPAKGAALFWVWCARELDLIVVETWIEVLREKLKLISSLLRLGASVYSLRQGR